MSRSMNRADTPYLVLTALATAAIVWSLMFQDPFAGGSPSAAGGTTSTAADPSGSTLPDGTGTTLPDGSDTTNAAVSTTLPSTPLSGIALEPIAEGFAQPVFPIAMPGEDVLLVVERGGRIKRVDPSTGEVDSTLFLEVVDRTRANAGIEVGLLGLAFHPDFETNRRVFIYYTNLDFDAVVIEYQVNASGIADPTTEKLILEVDRLAEGEHRHNAGMMQFGPDGYLYIGSGDNGEFSVNPQDPNTLKGGILRIDVDSASPYTTPGDNPWADGTGAPETWAIGLRNPWRFAIDPVDQLMYIGDVGQSTWEEINVVPLTPAGYNFGWPQMEGAMCWSPPSGCQTDGMQMPVVEVNHDGGHCSMTAGYVYRGAAMPELTGHFFFSDWCSGFIRSFRYENGEAGEVTDWGLEDAGQVTSFGLDADGELLITTWTGSLMRLIPER